MTHWCSYRTIVHTFPTEGIFFLRPLPLWKLQLTLFIHFFKFCWSYRASTPRKFQSLLLGEFFFGTTHFDINCAFNRSMEIYLLYNVDVNHNCFIVLSGQHRTSQGRGRRRETCCESMKVDSRQAPSLAATFALILLTCPLITLLEHCNLR